MRRRLPRAVRGVLHELVPQPQLSAVASYHNGDRLIAWVAVPTHLFPPFDHSRGVEALHLLRMLRRADAAAWKHELLHAWPHEATRWLSGAKKKGKMFDVGLQILVREERDVVRLNRGLFTLETPSDAYLSTQATLAASMQISKVTSAFTVPVCILVGSTTGLPSQSRLVRALMRLIELQSEQQNADVRADGCEERPVSQILVVGLKNGSRDSLSVAALTLLGQIAVRGVMVRDFSWVDHEEDDDGQLAHARNIARAIRLLFRLDGSLAVVSGVETLTIDYDAQNWIFPALLSAAQASSSLRSIRICERVDGSFRLPVWKQIAYSLFSRDATNRSLGRVEIDMASLKRDHVAAMRNVLEADDPFRQCFSLSIDLATSSAFVRTSQVYLLDPTARGATRDNSRLLVLPSAVRVRVIDRDAGPTGTFWRVYLPGCGVAWVAIDAASTRAEASQRSDGDDVHVALPRRQQSTHWITALSVLTMSEESADAVYEFLRLVGARVQTLELYYTSERPLDEWCRRVLDACLWIHEFRLSEVPIDDVQAIVEVCAARECALTSLALGRVSSVRTSRLDSLFHALSDPHHRLATSLQELEVQLPIDSDRDLFIIGDVCRMLASNRVLHTIRLRIDVYALFPGAKSAIEGLLDQHIDCDVPIRSAPLELDQKIAFLSVFASDSDTGPSFLDEGPLALVFEFAAASRLRKLEVATFYPQEY